MRLGLGWPEGCRIAAMLKELVTRFSIIPRLNAYLYRPNGDECHNYHGWYYNTNVWQSVRWLGVQAGKSVSDLWNYQEILVELKPSLVIEFGTCHGGSALYFASIMRMLGEPFRVLSVDISHAALDPVVRRDSDIELRESSSIDPAVAARIRELKAAFPGKIFAILDSDHSKDHVLAEMKSLRPLLSAGDYLIVEDSNINGHPVLPGIGPGPYEAIEAYVAEFPDDYLKDSKREAKFGFTFAPEGFLVRR